VSEREGEPEYTWTLCCPKCGARITVEPKVPNDETEWERNGVPCPDCGASYTIEWVPTTRGDGTP
jgi:DNA-directed RNA polymerase subunit RPC12/RpoP